MIAIMLALVLYTFGIFGFRQMFQRIFLGAIMLGVVSDWVATALMGFSRKGLESPHGIVGALALLGMTVLGLHALFAFVISLRRIGDARVSGSSIFIRNCGHYLYYFWLISLMLGVYVHIMAK